MSQFIFRRLLIFFPMMFVMSVVVFGLILMPPGDYLTSLIERLEEDGSPVSVAQAEDLRRQYGLDQSFDVQYWKWISGVVRWDLGESLSYGRPVTELINDRLLMTVTLGLFTVLFTWTLAIPIGIISAVKQYSVIDHFFTFLSYLGIGTPNFMLALIMMYTALAVFNWSVIGLYSFEYVDAPWSFGKFVDLLKHLWVPMLILGTAGTAGFTRRMRANLLDEMSKPYVETARAKGLPEWKLILKYPVRIAVNPFISTVGWELPELLSGDVIVATVMALPTVGPILLEALLVQDMYTAGSILLILTGLTVIGTLISDILLAWMDPRIRIGA